MDGTMYVVLEAHARCATLYLRGPLTHAVLERAVALCGALPSAVGDLRIDARGVDAADAWVSAGIGAIARAWRAPGGLADPPRGAVTISLHARGPAETGSSDVPVIIEPFRAAPTRAAPPP